MAKSNSLYVCNNCSAESLKWLGQCPNCGEWGTMEEIDGKVDFKMSELDKVELIKINSVKTQNLQKISTGFSELDRVLGGGFLPSEVILLSGEPGIGKSTLLLEVAGKFKGKTIYVSAEESLEQVAIRAERVGVGADTNLEFVSAYEVNSFLEKIAPEKPQLLIVDSVQTVFDSNVRGMPGGIAQIKAVSSKLVTYAKKNHVTLILVGQITKEGSIAGPKLLEHLVDVVMQFEGDDNKGYRVLRCYKNRFGPTMEVGIFEMTEKGIQDVLNPSLYFLDSLEKPKIGICPGVIVEGNRILVVEVQALSIKTYFSLPKRVAEGVSKSKLEVLTAIISKYGRQNLQDKDIYVNIAGGLKVKETTVDLPLVLSIMSSVYEKTLPHDIVAYGEISLTGDIRYTTKFGQVEKEIKRLGYKSFKEVYKNINHISGLGKIFRK